MNSNQKNQKWTKNENCKHVCAQNIKIPLSTLYCTVKLTAFGKQINVSVKKKIIIIWNYCLTVHVRTHNTTSQHNITCRKKSRRAWIESKKRQKNCKRKLLRENNDWGSEQGAKPPSEVCWTKTRNYIFPCWGHRLKFARMSVLGHGS